MLKHKFDLLKQGVHKVFPAGKRIMANPGIMAMATITLKKGGIREPHWHPNADELAYCVKGKALVTIFSPGNLRDTFTLSPGEVMFVPKGYIHHIENISSETCEFVLGYDNEKPEDLDLSESVGSMSTHVLGATFGIDGRTFKKLTKIKDVFITQKKTLAKLADKENHYKFDLESIKPQIKTKGGLARIVNQSNFPVLKHLALFSLRIAKGGIREPHWHPNATELNFVVNGKARLTIFSPGGKKDTFELTVGQGSIIPAGYFHHIENIGTSEMHMTVFFNNEMPDDIGLSGALSAYSKETLSSLFSTDPEFFAKLHKFRKDRMIVEGG